MLMAGELDALLFIGGQLKAFGNTDDFYSRTSKVIGTFLQIKNLSVLVGAGPSSGGGTPLHSGRRRYAGPRNL
jgi:hypothetical protein